MWEVSTSQNMPTVLGSASAGKYEHCAWNATIQLRMKVYTWYNFNVI